MVSGGKKRLPCLAAFICMCLAWVPPAVRAAEPAAARWPVYRGNQALTGVAEGRLPNRLKVRWTFAADDAVTASAVIGSRRVYVASMGGMVYALDRATGEKVWEFDTGTAVEASPLLLEGRVYAGSMDGSLIALDAGSGKKLWVYETDGRITGSANWTRTSPGGSPRLLVGSYDNRLHCVDAASGKRLWSYATESYINGTPGVIESPRAIAAFGGCDGKLHRVALPGGSSLGGIDAGSYVAASVALSGTRAYFGTYGNQLLCVDVASGKQLWSYSGGAEGGAFFSTPAVGAERVVVGSRDRKVHCVGRRDGRQIWTFSTGGSVDSSPVICGAAVVVGSADGRLYMIALSDGAPVCSYQIGSGILASPAVADGLVVIGAGDGRVYAFGE